MPTVVEQDVKNVCARVGESLRAFDGRTVLIAGAGGFLPSYFLDVLAYANDHLFATPCRVIGLDNFITGVPERIAHLKDRKGFELLSYDITRPFHTPADVDFVLHGASIASPVIYRKHPLETLDVNTTGTRNLLELARAKRPRGFLYLSSSEIYGDPSPDSIPTREDYRGLVSCTGPRACYDESKRLAETLCTLYHRQYGLPVKVVRPFNVYGPRLSLNDGRVVPDFLRNGLEGKPITLLSDGRATRSFCYIEDAVTAMLLLLASAEYQGEVFNVGNDEEVSMAAVANTVNELFGGIPGVRFGKSEDRDYLTDNPNRRCPDLTKLKAAVPWQPRVMLREGLQRTIESYRQVRQEVV